MKVMALDVGDVRIGIALSDDAGVFAFPRETYTRVSRKEDERYLAELAKAEQVQCLVYGLPYNMNGTLGPQAEKTTQFIKRLGQRFRHDEQLMHIEMIPVDERLTSVMADKAMLMQDKRRAERKQYVDALAASLILQTFLDSKHRRET